MKNDLLPEVKTKKRDDEGGTRQSVNFTQHAARLLTEVFVSTFLGRLRTEGKLVLALARGYEKAALTDASVSKTTAGWKGANSLIDTHGDMVSASIHHWRRAGRRGMNSCARAQRGQRCRVCPSG